jgi:methyl-accepting chemotaxis protein
MEEQAQSLAEAVSVFRMDQSASGAGKTKRLAAPRSAPTRSAAPAKATQRLSAKPKSAAEEDEWSEF